MSQSPRDSLREHAIRRTDEMIRRAATLDEAATLEQVARDFAAVLNETTAAPIMSELLVDALEVRDGSEGATILAAIAKLGSGQAVAMADAALQRLRERGVAPTLPEGLGDREVQDAAVQPQSDRDIYVFRLGWPGERAVEAGYFAVDRGKGALVEGSLSHPGSEQEADALMNDLEGGDPLVPSGQRISVEQLAHAVREACNSTRELELTVDFELSYLLEVAARVFDIDRTRLPAIQQGIGRVDFTDEKMLTRTSLALMSNAALATLETPDGGTAGSDAPAVRNIKVVVASMLEWKRARGDGELTHWTVEYIEAFLLEDAPRAFATKQELIAGAPDCAASFLGYLSRTGMLTGDPLTQLLACCDERRDELAKAQPRP